MERQSGKGKGRRIEVRKAGAVNPLRVWPAYVSPTRVVRNWLLITVSKVTPSLSFKNWLLRRTGMKIGKNVSIGLDVMFDIFFPENIEIGDNSVIGYGATLLGHEFLVKEWRTGKIKVGKDCMIGALSLVMPGVEIGDGATVAAYSLVNRDVPPGGFYGGVPARSLR
jgi:acetyltransferase-like isoleucine patch superfamily enzyme